MGQQILNLFQTTNCEIFKVVEEGDAKYLQSNNDDKYLIENNIIYCLDNVPLTGNNHKYQHQYDKIAKYYDIATKFYAFLKDGNERKRVMQYLSCLQIKNDDKVIEISIGTGRNIKYLNPQAEYWGIDISSEMLKMCQKKMKRLKRDIVLIQAEAENLPIKNGSFDVVYSAGGFNFFNNPAKAVNEMLRIAKKGAQLMIYDETENLRLKHQKNKFYKDIKIKNPVEYLPDSCKNVHYREICKGDLYVLTFQKA